MNIVIRLLTYLFNLKQLAWVWSSIFVALLFVRLLQSIPVTFSGKVLKPLATTLDHVFHKQPLMHVQRKVFFNSCDFVISMIIFVKLHVPISPNLIWQKLICGDYVRILTTNLRYTHVISGFKIFEIFSNTALLFSCLVIPLLLNRDAFSKIYWFIT